MIPTPNDYLSKVVNDGVQRAIVEAIEAELESAKKRLEEKIRGSVGAIAATICTNLSYERVGTDLVITLKIDVPKHDVRIEQRPPVRDRWLEQNDPLR